MGVSRSDSVQLRRVIAGVSWAIHGLILEFEDGTREAQIVSSYDEDIVLDDESILRKYGDSWVDIDDGDYVVQVKGKNFGLWTYLCSNLTLVLASGREISFTSPHCSKEEVDFSYDVEQPGLLRNIHFSGGECDGIDVVQTNIHLPITRSIALELPVPERKQLEHIMLVSSRIDAERVSDENKAIGSDIWWKVLGMLRGCDLIPFTTNRSMNDCDFIACHES